MALRNTHTPLSLVLVALLALTTSAGFVFVPAGTILPVHWGISGQADAFAPREVALLLLPAIAVGTSALLFCLQRAFGAASRRASRHVMAAALPALSALFLAVQAGIVLIGIGQAVDMVRIVVLGIGLLFIVLGNVMPKTQPNWVAGIRLPWTLADPANWQATHRLGGLLMMLGGTLIVIAPLVTGHTATLLVVTLVGALLPMIVAGIYSYRLAHRPRPQ